MQLYPHRIILAYVLLYASRIAAVETTLQQDEAQARIVGGTPAQVGEFPSFVWTAGSQLCGGSLIWDDILLTAAHCVGAFVERGVLYNGVNINGGADELFQEVQVELPHPNYNTTIRDANDIMLVKLSSPISMIPLQEVNYDSAFPVDEAPATVMGFGRTIETGNISEILLQTEVPIVGFDTCNEVFGRIVDEVMVCAGGVSGRDSK